MPMVISGYLAIDTRKLREHEGHQIEIAVRPNGLVMLICAAPCAATIEMEPEPRTDLPCGCRDQKSHDAGVAIQTKTRKDFRIPRSTCVGCYLGDDSPSIHSCAIHQF